MGTVNVERAPEMNLRPWHRVLTVVVFISLLGVAGATKATAGPAIAPVTLGVRMSAKATGKGSRHRKVKFSGRKAGRRRNGPRHGKRSRKK